MRTALQHSSRALQTTRQQLDSIVAHAPVGIAQTDLSGRYVLANGRYCSIVGRSEQTLRQVRMQNLTHPEDAGQHEAERARMLRTGRPFSLEKRYVRPDGSEIWVVTHMSIVPDHQGRPVHILAAVQDIMHRRAAERALRALAASLEQRVAEAVAERAVAEEGLRQAQRLEALGQLAGGVAHDFNNVLQAIAGAARLIQRRPGDKAGVERLAGLMVDAAERGATVTRRLLSFARRGELRPEPVMVADVLSNVCAALGPQVRVETESQPGLAPVLADREQLETVLLTLAGNARDAMAGGGTGATVRMRAMRDDNAPAGLPTRCYVRIEVEDSGPGMDAETLAHATEPFFSTKPRGRGTGLGLAMARGFAEQSGGQLQLRSVPGQGTTVALWLPEAESFGKGRSPHIVLVDDDADVRTVLAEVLAASGCTVHALANAADALTHLRSAAQVDLVISDLSMPDTDGLTLIRTAQDHRPSLPAILLTGYGGQDLEAAVKQMANVRLLGKPVRGSTLMSHVSALLGLPT